MSDYSQFTMWQLYNALLHHGEQLGCFRSCYEASEDATDLWLYYLGKRIKGRKCYEEVQKKLDVFQTFWKTHYTETPEEI